MSKDPAFLFYSSDFLTGIVTMTFEDRGKYITLLSVMHQKGRLSEETIWFVVGSVSVMLKSKFLIDENGLWYNKRLEEEIFKRENFVESRRSNGCKGGRPKKEKTYNKPYAKPSGKPTNNLHENENENENEIENKEEKEKRRMQGGKRKKREKEKEPGIIIPWPDDSFQMAWNHWKEYKLKEFNFGYKSAVSEQTALNDLCEKADGHMENALKIIQKAIASGWKGLFKLTENEQVKRTIKTSEERDREFDEAFARFNSRL